MNTLDVGCGCKTVHTPRGDVGVDLHSNPNGNPSYFAVADGHHLPFPDEQFSCISMYEVLEHAENPAGCIHEAHRVLKPDGVFCLSVPNVFHWRILLWTLLGRQVSRDHVHGFNKWDIENLLTRCGFTVTRSNYVLVPERWRHDKLLHRFADWVAYELGVFRRFTGASLYIECKKGVNKKFGRDNRGESAWAIPL